MSIGRWPQGADLLVAGYFNAGQSDLEVSAHAEEISEELAKDGLEYMITHF